MLSLQVGQLVLLNFSELVKIVGMFPPIENIVSVIVVCLVINLYVSFLRRRAHNLFYTVSLSGQQYRLTTTKYLLHSKSRISSLDICKEQNWQDRSHLSGQQYRLTTEVHW